VDAVDVTRALLDTRGAFDRVAPTYDRSNAENRTLCEMRARTLQVLDRLVPRGARVLNLGCGPGREVQLFLEDALSNHADFTLFDFNDETLNHAGGVLGELRNQFGRSTRINLQKKSVQRLLREATKPGQGEKFDFVYCAGLFDYLPDRVCKELLGVFYEWLAPDGLVLTTNVVDSKPFRHMLEFVLDWHLIYRTGLQCQKLRPPQCAAENYTVKADITGVNLFMEARKPKNG